MDSRLNPQHVGLGRNRILLSALPGLRVERRLFVKRRGTRFQNRLEDDERKDERCGGLTRKNERRLERVTRSLRRRRVSQDDGERKRRAGVEGEGETRRTGRLCSGQCEDGPKKAEGNGQELEQWDQGPGRHGVRGPVAPVQALGEQPGCGMHVERGSSHCEEYVPYGAPTAGLYPSGNVSGQVWAEEDPTKHRPGGVM